MGRLAARLLLAALLAAAVAVPARAALLKTDTFRLYGDFRLRGEVDWDSQNAAGIMREDRTRLRVRFRVGFLLNPNEHWQMEARLRTCQELSQQSPHVTILQSDGSDIGSASFRFDRWYLRGTYRELEVWAGRNNIPFWRQDELAIDDDVTMPGIALRWKNQVGPGPFSLAGGYFSLPVGMTLFSGNLAAGQAVYQPRVGPVDLIFAAEAELYRADPDNPNNIFLLQGNGSRDYTILSGNVRASWLVRERVLAIGTDLMHNTEHYDPNDIDPVTAANYDQRDGYVLLVTYSSLRERHNWVLGYYYSHLETFAVNNSYSEDDWVRWGTPTQTRASNMMGHEFRFGWAFSADMNLLARLYLVDSITTIEDGKRFRIDFNYSF